MRIFFVFLVLISTSAFSIPSFPYFLLESLHIGNNYGNNIRDFGDILRNFDSGSHNDLLNDETLKSVTHDFGFSIISTKNLPMKSASGRANITPWSSWWFPKREDRLFNDSARRDGSALTKYDLVRKSRTRSNVGSAAAYEKKSYNPNSQSWEGLCDAWALASIAQPEPQKPVTIFLNNNSRTSGSSVTFTISDLKALLLKTYEASEDTGLKYYGQKFTGDIKGWIYPDIFPEQFHRFIEMQLFEKKEPFIMDHDAGVQVWNVPVYKANYTISAVPNEPNSIFVRTWLYSAESTKSEEDSFVGTKEAVREYNYVLQGTRDGNGDLVIDSGYWVKGPDGVDSRKDHPDYFISVPDPRYLVRKSYNPEIEISLVDEILSRSR